MIIILIIFTILSFTLIIVGLLHIIKPDYWRKLYINTGRIKGLNPIILEDTYTIKYLKMTGLSFITLGIFIFIIFFILFLYFIIN